MLNIFLHAIWKNKIKLNFMKKKQEIKKLFSLLSISLKERDAH